MNRTIHYAVVLLGGLIFFLSCSKSPEQKAAALYQDVVEQVSVFDFTRAAKTLDKIKEIDPANPLITAGKGLITEQHLWTIDAFDDYATLMKNAPTLPEGYLGAYRIQKRLGAFDDALTTADAAARVNPKKPEAISLLAEAILNAGLPQLANRIIDSALHVGLAQPEADFLRARTKFLLGDTDSAHVYASSALAKKMDSPRFCEVAADYYETIGYGDSAVLFSKMEMDASVKQPVVWITHCDRTLRLGYFAAAREAQREMMKRGADSSVILGLQADYLNATNRFIEASNASMWLSRFTTPDNLSRPLHEIQARVGTSDQVQVSDLLSGVLNPLENKPMNEQARQFLFAFFMIHFAGNSPSVEGLDFITKVYGPETSRRDYRIAWASLLYNTGYFKRVDSLVEFFDAHFGSQADWQYGLGDLYANARQRNFDAAKERYEKAMSLSPNSVPAFVSYLTTLENFWHYPEAEQLFERFPQFAQRYPDLALRQASLLALLGKRTEAMPIFEAAISKRSGDMRAINRFFDALSQRFDSEGKQQALDILAKVAPDNPDIIALLAEQELNKGEFADVKSLSEKGIQLDPDLIVLYAFKASALYKTNQQEEALHLYDSLYAIYQYDPDLEYQYSRLLTEYKLNLNQASNLARGAVMYSNYSVQKYLHLIDTYVAMGRNDLAWTESSNLATAYPMRPEPMYRLGLTGKALGKPEAKQVLARSIELGLGGPDLDNAKKLLAELK